MEALAFLIPAALFLGLLGLAAFLWSLRSGQYDDLDGAAHRILLEDEAPQATADENARKSAGRSQDSSVSTKAR